MTGQLHEVVAGVALRCGEDGIQAAIDRLLLRADKGGQSGSTGRLHPETGDHPAGDVDDTGTTQANDGESGAAGRSCQGNDRIREHIVKSVAAVGSRAAPGLRQALRLARAGLVFVSGDRVFTSTMALAVRFCRSRASIHCCGMLAMLLTA